MVYNVGNFCYRIALICIVFLHSSSFAMRLNVSDKELNKTTHSIFISISTYDTSLDSEKFIVETEEKTRVRKDLIKRKIFQGCDFISSYTASRNTYRKVLKLIKPEFVYDEISSEDEINFCDEFLKILASKDKPKELRSLTEPFIYPAYRYCHRGLVALYMKLSTPSF